MKKLFFPEISQKPFLGTFGLNAKNLQCKTPTKGHICIFLFSLINSIIFMEKITGILPFSLYFFIFLKITIFTKIGLFVLVISPERICKINRIIFFECSDLRLQIKILILTMGIIRVRIYLY